MNESTPHTADKPAEYIPLKQSQTDRRRLSATTLEASFFSNIWASKKAPSTSFSGSSNLGGYVIPPSSSHSATLDRLATSTTNSSEAVTIESASRQLVDPVEMEFSPATGRSFDKGLRRRHAWKSACGRQPRTANISREGSLCAVNQISIAPGRTETVEMDVTQNPGSQGE
ncbi:unnamed protein product [Protopolystoma xenopodis]|uniref:Uncharacterized protein n=1 Tax=Protopolystoma xenopodis TaxID=117903 RepID=A0A3S5AZ96_9PLAT|nr:unnamed protein product [Protopolystoma xenopodis]